MVGHQDATGWKLEAIILWQVRLQLAQVALRDARKANGYREAWLLGSNLLTH